MLMPTDQESDYSELKRFSGACVCWLPWESNHSKSRLHKSHTHIWHSLKSATTAKVFLMMKGCLSERSDHKDGATELKKALRYAVIYGSIYFEELLFMSVFRL